MPEPIARTILISAFPTPLGAGRALLGKLCKISRALTVA